jgi:histidine triad (HIT) family protein
MTDCVFCRVAAHQIPAKIAYEDDRIFAFDDINPQAPLHVLIIPKAHIATLNDLVPSHDGLAGEMIRRAAAIAKDRGFHERGFRTVFNCNSEAGQTVFHIHLHLLAGRPLRWPPG